MNVPKYIQVAFILVIIFSVIMFVKNSKPEEVKELNADIESDVAVGSQPIIDNSQTQQVVSRTDREELEEATDTTIQMNLSKRDISILESAVLPIKNIVPSTQVKHSIPLNEIRQGCSIQDCIPSVDSPEFIATKKALRIVDADQIGIALSYKEVDRFYPFSMLVTRELVNDVVSGDALLVSYCPLCGTGIVFNRTVEGVVYEFGVSGMLWQSNLLMYNRSESLEDRSLWSQVLGEAVVGNKTGMVLESVSSDIMKFGVWAEQNPKGSVLDTGSQRDPYNGDYYGIAQRFAPNFDAQTSPFAPDSYVYGVEVDGIFKAYPRDLLTDGVVRDMINGIEILITIKGAQVAFTNTNGDAIKDVEGFWFSWVAAHPQTEVWTQ